jgi:hypothetical protein
MNTKPPETCVKSEGARRSGVDGHACASWLQIMQTVLDVGERLLNVAEQQGRWDGKSLGALVEDALRAVLHAPESLPSASGSAADPVG